jgi:hypothetical protein
MILNLLSIDSIEDFLAQINNYFIFYNQKNYF